MSRHLDDEGWCRWADRQAQWGTLRSSGRRIWGLVSPRSIHPRAGPAKVAKVMPTVPLRLAVTTPTTSSRQFSAGPLWLPGVTAALMWRTLSAV